MTLSTNLIEEGVSLMLREILDRTDGTVLRSVDVWKLRREDK